MVELVCFKCAVIVYDKSQSRTLLNTSLISAVPYSFSCIYRISDIVELVCFKCAVIVYDEAH